MIRLHWCASLVVAALVNLVGSCTPPEAGELADRETVDVQINGHAFQAWVADEPGERQQGLMYTTAEEMAPLADGTERAMLFVFDYDQPTSQGFWMDNVVIPLDIAFIRSDGTIATIRTMAPLEKTSYYSEASYRYTLEVNANVYSRLGISVGDTVQIPESILNR
ncbi:MAG: DUF192 domain-containing protein [Planctomycetes bacterium]|nr:DUF192 domain-containing protein [Planctomycetota bacterium]